MSDWWAQRLGGRPAATQAPQQAPPNQWQQQPPNQYQQPNQYPQYQQPQGPPKVTIHNLLDAVSHWQGGEGARNSTRCHSCGSPNMFSRGPNMAPQCYDCGANPRFGPQGQLRTS